MKIGDKLSSQQSRAAMGARGAASSVTSFHDTSVLSLEQDQVVEVGCDLESVAVVEQ